MAHEVGSPMTFWVLPASCRVIARSTVSQLTEDELADPVIKNRIAELDLAIAEKIGNAVDDVDDALIGLFSQKFQTIYLFLMMMSWSISLMKMTNCPNPMSPHPKRMTNT